MNKIINTERNEEKIEGNKNINNDEVQRIIVSKEAHGALCSVVERVNDGFGGGKVNKAQMANWILMRFNGELDEIQIKQIQLEHFDEVAMLETILRQAKDSGKVPTDFKILLQKQLGLGEVNKKKTPRP